MLLHDEIDQFEDNYNQELGRLYAARTKYKASLTADAAEFVAYLDESLILLVKKITNEKWMSVWASRQPVTTITFLNSIYEALQNDKLWDVVNNDIQHSAAFKILQTEYPKECKKYLGFDVLSKEDLRRPAVLDFFRMNEREPEAPAIRDPFKTAVGDFQTFTEVQAVRDEARRRLIGHALISHDFKSRAAAYSIGYKSDGAMAGSVRVLFGTPDYKRETIEPVIKAWRYATMHPFQPVIDELVALGTVQQVEAKIQEFYPALLMKAAVKCNFVKVRMAESLDISEKTVSTQLTDLGLEDWYLEAHKDFLKKTCETVGYNFSQVATLLNVDVRYVVQQMANYKIEKPDESNPRSSWPGVFPR